jgi:nucleoside-diphosphate-sugar epimerase
LAKILISGANGFVGRHLLRHLEGRHDLYALIRPGSFVPDIRATWIEADLGSALDTSRFPEQIDAVIHLAQSANYRAFPAQAIDIFNVNIRSTQYLLEYARQAQASHFLFASSGGVYGNKSEVLSEEMPINPLDNALGYYLTSKYAAELLISNYQQFFNTIMFRFFFIYGHGQRSEMLVPGLVRKVMQGEEITIQGKPGLRINPVYISDAVQVFEPALRLANSAVINVAGSEIVTLTRIVEIIQLLSGRQAIIRHANPEMSSSLVASITVMKSLLGITPQTSVEAGLRQTLSEQT